MYYVSGIRCLHLIIMSCLILYDESRRTLHAKLDFHSSFSKKAVVGHEHDSSYKTYYIKNEHCELLLLPTKRALTRIFEQEQDLLLHAN